MKYRKGDEAIDMEILPGGDGDKEKLPIGKNYVIVVTARGMYTYSCCLYRNIDTHGMYVFFSYTSHHSHDD